MYLYDRLRPLAAAAFLAAACAPGWAQGPSPAPGSRAAQLPLSGRAQPGAVVTQSAAPPPGSSVDTLNSQVEVQGAYAGSILDPGAPAGSLVLTLADAVRRGLAFNLGVVGADDALRESRAQMLASRAPLLPNLSAALSENAAKINLEAEGFSASAFGASLPFHFPTTVGPFHYYDARASLQQSLLDLTAVHNYRSGRDLAGAASAQARQAREEVVLAVAGAYLELLASRALVAEQQAEVRYAEASYRQAREQAEAGTKAPIDANRSLVELQTEQQRLLAQEGEMQKETNSLARLIGLPLGLELDLAENLTAPAAEAVPVEEAVRRGWSQRQDLKAAEAQLKAAEEARKAAGAEYLPSGSISGFYGLEGINPSQGATVFQASAAVNIPIFQGGRAQADTAQAEAVLAQRRAELSDEREAVELDVRNSYVDLNVATAEVRAAESNRRLALETLRQSQDRFSVGVADSVEVVNSQEELAAADRDYVGSLFSQHLARISLARAMGEAEKDLPDLFRKDPQSNTRGSK